MPGDIRQAYDVRQGYSDRKSPGLTSYSTPSTQVTGKSPQQCTLAARVEQSSLLRGASLEERPRRSYANDALPSFRPHEFITVSGESRPGLPPDEAARDLFARFSTELNAHGLSLDDTVRTRLWGRDRAARDGGSGVRVQILSGKARSASSSYISPPHFDSAAAVAVDLWAMRGAAQKTVKEYDPPIVPPRYIATSDL